MVSSQVAATGAVASWPGVGHGCSSPPRLAATSCHDPGVCANPWSRTSGGIGRPVYHGRGDGRAPGSGVLTRTRQVE